MKETLKPTPLKLFITAFFTFWVYFYELGAFKGQVFEEALYLIREGVKFVDWGSTFLMKISYGTLWIFVTIIIFGGMVIFDRIYTGIHNAMVVRGYVKQSGQSGPDFLRKAETAIRHERFLIYWIAVFLILFVSLFYLSNWSLLLANQLLWNYIYSVPERWQIYVYLIVLIPFWYIVSMLIAFLIRVEKKEEFEEKIEEEHSALLK